MPVNGLRIEEKSNTNKTLVQEIRRECRDPMEQGEPSTTLQHEESDDLLEEQPDDDSRPWDMCAMT